MEITQEEIKYFIKNPQLVSELRTHTMVLQKRIAEVEDQYGNIMKEVCESIQMGVHYDAQAGSGSGKVRDLGDIMEMTRKMLGMQHNDLMAQMLKSLNQMEKIHRLLLVIDTLSATQRYIIQKIDGEKELWEALAIDMNMSKMQLSRIRRQTIKDIEKRFNSSLTNGQLARQKVDEVIPDTKKNIVLENKEIKGQMTIDDLVKQS